MRASSHPSDERLLRRLLAPPDLDEGHRSLSYWRERSRRLPWYRVRARREAIRMTVRWERRVGAALISQHDAPIAARLSVGLLLARTRLGRWARRARIAVLSIVSVAVAIVVLPVAAALAFLLHTL